MYVLFAECEYYKLKYMNLSKREPVIDILIIIPEGIWGSGSETMDDIDSS